MKLIIDKCSQCTCGGKRPIVNKRHYLCQEKNYERRHGESQLEAKIKRSKELLSKKVENISVLKRKHSKSFAKTSKQSEIDREYVRVCREIDEEREHICSGCGLYEGQVPLSHSHLISRSGCKRIGRPELIAEKENIVYHCIDSGNRKGCHGKWETSQRKQLLDYERNIAYIRTIDPLLANKLEAN